MFWKKSNRFFHSVKFRTAVGYALLFAGASLLLFFAVHYLLKDGMIKAVDRQLLALSRELEDRYFKAPPAEKLAAVTSSYQRESYYQGSKRIFFRVLDRHGHVLAESAGKSWLRLGRQPGYRDQLTLGRPATAPVPSRSAVRILDRPLTEGNLLETGIDLSPEEDLLKLYQSVFFTVFGILVALSAVVGWLLASRAMQGVEQVSAAATALSHGDFGCRVDAGRAGTEVEALAAAFNEMRTRIEALIFELKEVSDNVAHDLRTPLTRIRGLAETTVAGHPAESDYQAMAGGVVEECDRLIGMINTMLEITRTGTGTVKLERQNVDLAAIATQAHELFQPLAEMKNLEFILATATVTAIVPGDRARLQRAVANLLDNAIKYTPEHGRVELAVTRTEQQVKLTVTDNGPGIAPAELPHIFERFYRCDASRTQTGNGLGLSLVEAIVKAHHGRIQADSVPGRGSTFTITLGAGPV